MVRVRDPPSAAVAPSVFARTLPGHLSFGISIGIVLPPVYDCCYNRLRKSPKADFRLLQSILASFYDFSPSRRLPGLKLVNQASLTFPQTLVAVPSIGVLGQ
jgi:hypothetical protein